jgi:hypothetical protein
MDLNKLEDTLTKLFIEPNGTFDEEKDTYTIVLEDSDKFAQFYSLLDLNDSLTLLESGSMTGEFASVLKFGSDDYTFTLNANFLDNYYSLVVEEIK